VFILKSLLFSGFIEFVVMVQKGSGKFEVTEGGLAVVSGTVQVLENVSHGTASLKFFESQTNDDLLELSSWDIYTELRLRGYNYRGDFCGLVSLDNSGEFFFFRFACNSAGTEELPDDDTHVLKYVGAAE
jgi:fatty acid synthase